MSIIWLIDAEQDFERSEELQSAIRRHGFDCRAVKFFPESRAPGDIVGAEHIPLDARVVFFGGPALMHHIQLKRRWTPGGWCTFDNLHCAVYYCYFGKYLLNEQYTLLPAIEAARQALRIFDQYAADGKVFVRPAIARKVFNGSCFDIERFRSSLTQRIDPREQVVVSAPKPIGREWRVFVAHDKVITGSQYANLGRAERSSEFPDEVRAFAQNILKEQRWRPDPLFTLDICESSGQLAVVEINGFSCSNPYHADLDAIINAVENVSQSALAS